MTAKEALRELIDDLSEEKAAEVLEWLEWEVRYEPRPLALRGVRRSNGDSPMRPPADSLTRKTSNVSSAWSNEASLE